MLSEILCAVLLASSLAACPIDVSNAFSSDRDKVREGSLGSQIMGKPAKTLLKDLTLTVVYDNNHYGKALQTAWGFSCVIQGAQKTILFDTGGDGAVLLGNMQKLGIDPLEIDAVVLSHIHSDHVGGLAEFLRKNPHVTVYLPKSFPEDFKSEVKARNAVIVEVAGPEEICRDVYSTGELGTTLEEQSLVIATDKGAIVITGCAHPGIVWIVEEAGKMTSGSVYLVLGGFHLLGETRQGIEKTISRLKALKVANVGPCHCSGDRARELFRMAWGKNYLDVGVGRVIPMRDLE
jgi:7,8-dihydropterin-6-yl-methyl-4-(beta-D-ribofuranosyl)aminobenzene 5'-phosphate synthase